MKKERKELTQKRVLELFEYHPCCGTLTWRVRRGRVKKGDITGCIDEDYRRVEVYGHLYYTHRLIWLYHYGFLPKMIDHKDQNTFNNRIENLRESNSKKNAQNTKVPKTNKSGITGICNVNNTVKGRVHEYWKVAIKKYGYVGRSKDFDEAVCLRYAAEQCLDWQNTYSTAEKYVKEKIQGRKV